MIRLKRAYEPAAATDGYRVLVERLWPRGLRREDAHFDAWMKDIAPSDELRKWFGHDPDRYRAFRGRYARELHRADVEPLLDALARRAAKRTVTLVYAARDEEHNSARVLARELDRRIARARGLRRTTARVEVPPDRGSEAKPRTRTRMTSPVAPIVGTPAGRVS